MSGTVHNFPDRHPPAQPSAAPPLPLEAQIAACAFSLAAARQRIAEAETLLRWSPRQQGAMSDVMRELGQAIQAADQHYAAFAHMLLCEGQA